MSKLLLRGCGLWLVVTRPNRRSLSADTTTQFLTEVLAVLVALTTEVVADDAAATTLPQIK